MSNIAEKRKAKFTLKLQSLKTNFFMGVEPDPEPLSHLDPGFTKKAGSGTQIFKIT